MIASSCRLARSLARYGVQLSVTPCQYALLVTNTTAPLKDLYESTGPWRQPSSSERLGHASALPVITAASEPRSPGFVCDEWSQSSTARSAMSAPATAPHWLEPGKRQDCDSADSSDCVAAADLWASRVFLQCLFSEAGLGVDAETQPPSITWKSCKPRHFGGEEAEDPAAATAALHDDGVGQLLGEQPVIFAFVRARLPDAKPPLPLRAHCPGLYNIALRALSRMEVLLRSAPANGVPALVAVSDLYSVYCSPVVPVVSLPRLRAVRSAPEHALARVVEARWLFQVRHRGRQLAPLALDLDKDSVGDPQALSGDCDSDADMEGEEEEARANDLPDLASEVDSSVAATSRSSSFGSYRRLAVGADYETAVDEIDDYADDRLFYYDNDGAPRYYADEDQLAGVSPGTPYWDSEGRMMYAPPGHPLHQPEYEPTEAERVLAREIEAEREEQAALASRASRRRPAPKKWTRHSLQQRLFLGTRLTAPVEALGRRPLIDAFRDAHKAQCTRASNAADFAEAAATSASAMTVILEHAASGGMERCIIYRSPAALYQALHDSLNPLRDATPPPRCPPRPGLPACLTCIVLGVLFALVAARHNGVADPRFVYLTHAWAAASFARASAAYHPFPELVESQRLPGWRAKRSLLARCTSVRTMAEAESVTRSEHTWAEVRLSQALASPDSGASVPISRLDLAYTAAALNALCSYRVARVVRSVEGEPALQVIELYVDMLRGAFLLETAIPPAPRSRNCSNAKHRDRSAATITARRPSLAAVNEGPLAEKLRRRTMSDIAWRMLSRSMTQAHYLPAVDPLVMAVRWLGRLVFSDRARGSGPGGRAITRAMAPAGFLNCVAAVAESPDLLLHGLAYGLERHNHSPVYSLLHAATCEPLTSFYVTIQLLTMVSHRVRFVNSQPRSQNDPDYHKFLPLAEFCDRQCALATRVYLSGFGGDHEPPELSTWLVVPTEGHWPHEFLAFAACGISDATLAEMIAIEMRTLSTYMADTAVNARDLSSNIPEGGRYSCLDGVNGTIRLARLAKDGPWIWRRAVSKIPHCGCSYCRTGRRRYPAYPYRDEYSVSVSVVMLRDLCAFTEVLHGDVPLIVYDNAKFITVKCARTAVHQQDDHDTVPFRDLVLLAGEGGAKVSDVFPAWKSPLAAPGTPGLAPNFDAAGFMPLSGASPLIAEAALVAPLIFVTTEADKAERAADYGQPKVSRRRLFASSSGRRRR